MLGTPQVHCSDRLCYCDRQTGSCRTNVDSHNCDRCAPTTGIWELLESLESLEFCHPQNSLSPQCSLISGPCHCRPGFGGQQCTEREPLHWGNPNVRCEDWGFFRGLDQYQYLARYAKEGLDRDASDQSLWDNIDCQVQCDLDNIHIIIAKVLEMGTVPGVGDAQICELQMKLVKV
ncbi:hypothetical protein SRHO_G00152080 [Serrasalmus rhombeus]